MVARLKLKGIDGGSQKSKERKKERGQKNKEPKIMTI